MKRYALVQKNKIIKFKNISDTDSLIVSKLLTHGYLPVEEQAVPTYDFITQTLLDSYEIQKDRILRVWTVEERSFEEAKQIKIESIKNETIDNIRVVFEEANQESKINTLLAIKDEKIAKVEAAKTNEELRKDKMEMK